MDGTNVELGSIADWLSGGGTTAAFAATTTFLIHDKISRRRSAECEQADAVSAWFEPMGNYIKVRNASEGVIYDVCVAVVDGSNASEGTKLPSDGAKIIRLVPPNTTISIFIGLGWGGMHFSPSVDLTFRDLSSTTWQRNNFGDLTKLKHDVVEHYGLSRPIDYDSYLHPSS